MDSELLDLLQQTVTIEPYTGQDGFGAPQYGAPVVYEPGSAHGGARIAREVKMVRASDGQEQVSSTVVWLDGGAVLDTRDRITLDDATQSPILVVESVPDADGTTHHHKLRLA